MKRAIAATCLAASFAVALAAQSTSTASSTQNPPGDTQRGPRPVTAIGCLRAGDTAGTFMLTDVQIQGARKPDDTTAGTTGSTAGTAGSTAGTTDTSEQTRRPPTTVMLSPAADVDLKAHVGHKIEVTGTMNAARPNSDPTASTTTGGTATSTGTAGTTGAAEQATRAPMRNVTVTSIRMISESCS